MPRKEPTLGVGKMGRFDLFPPDAQKLFNLSKAQTPLYIKTPYPDVARDGIEAMTNTVERQFVEAQMLQKDMRCQFFVDAIANEKRISNNYAAEQEMRQKFISVNNFLRDCQEKERVAGNTIVEEKQKHEQLQREIDQIKRETECLAEFQKKMEATLEDYKPYEDVIEQMVATSPLYKNAKDLMDRCDALMMGKDSIVQQEMDILNKIKNYRELMIQTTNEAAQHVMGLSNELSDLDNSYKMSKSNSFKWLRILSATKEYLGDHDAKTMKLLDQVYTLYLLFCRRSKQLPTMGRMQYDKLLDYILDEMKCMQDVIDTSKQRMIKQRRNEELLALNRLQGEN